MRGSEAYAVYSLPGQVGLKGHIERLTLSRLKQRKSAFYLLDSSSYLPRRVKLYLCNVSYNVCVLTDLNKQQARQTIL